MILSTLSLSKLFCIWLRSQNLKIDADLQKKLSRRSVVVEMAHFERALEEVCSWWLLFLHCSALFVCTLIVLCASSPLLCAFLAISPLIYLCLRCLPSLSSALPAAFALSLCLSLCDLSHPDTRWSQPSVWLKMTSLRFFEANSWMLAQNSIEYALLHYTTLRYTTPDYSTLDHTRPHGIPSFLYQQFHLYK